MSSPVTTSTWSPPRRARVRLDAVRQNVQALARDAQGRRVVVDVRGDAYGHGAAAIAPTLGESGARAILVSHEHTAVELRDAGVSLPIVVGIASLSTDDLLLGPEFLGLDSETCPDPSARGLVPAMTLSARVLSVKKVDEGEGVSYGYVYRTTRPTTLAMVGLGYSDGIDRHACEGGVAWFAGRLHPIAGRVAMDVFMLDVGDSPVSPGDEVVLFGDVHRGQPSPTAWARSLGKSAAEVTSTLGDRIVRSYS